MKSNHIIRLLLFTGLILQISCMKDKSNTDYVAGNPVDIKYPAISMTATIDEPLIIAPIRSFSVENKTVADYNHEWYQDGKLISTDADMVYNGNRTGAFFIKYYMIDKASGVRHGARHFMNLSVLSPYESGWSVLYEKDGESEIAHFRKSGDVYRDQLGMYKEKNGGEVLGSKPIRIKEYLVNGGRGLVVIQQGGQGTLELDGLTFEKKLVLSESFTGGTPANLKPINIGFYETADMLLNEDGALYSRLFKANPIAFTIPWLNIPLEGNKGMKIKHLWDVWGNLTYFTMMYDEKNNRLLTGALKIIPSVDAPGGVLKIDTIPPPPSFFPVPPNYINPSLKLGNYQYIWGNSFGDTYYSATCFFLVREPSSGEITAQTFNFMDIMGLQVMHSPGLTRSFTGKQYLNTASVFNANKPRNYLFFSGDADNRGLYYYDINTGVTKLYTRLPASITTIRSSDDGMEVAVGTTDGTAVLYNIKSNVLVSGNADELHRLSGLGRVADITPRGGYYK